jgi:hypothetical protein
MDMVAPRWRGGADRRRCPTFRKEDTRDEEKKWSDSVPNTSSDITRNHEFSHALA